MNLSLPYLLENKYASLFCFKAKPTHFLSNDLAIIISTIKLQSTANLISTPFCKFQLFLKHHPHISSFSLQQYTLLNIFKQMQKKPPTESLKRSLSGSLFTSSPKSNQNYIKISLQDEFQQIIEADNSNTKQSEQKTRTKRFTFSKVEQDPIKEEESFHRIDFGEFIELKSKLDKAKKQNTKLKQETSENIELFNSYMHEMEQRLSLKTKQIDTLSAQKSKLQQKIKALQSMIDQSRRRTVSLQKRISKKQYGLQCELSFPPKSSPFSQLMHHNMRQSSYDNKDIQIWQLEKDKYSMQKQIIDLKENHRKLALSFEKEIKVRQFQKLDENAKKIYYKTLNNSPRNTINAKANSIVCDANRLEFAESSNLNALISPRNCQNVRIKNTLQINHRFNNQMHLPQKMEPNADRIHANQLQSLHSSPLKFGKMEHKNYQTIHGLK